MLALAGPEALDNSRKTVIKYMDLHASERNRLNDNQFDNIFQHFERCNEWNALLHIDVEHAFLLISNKNISNLSSHAQIQSTISLDC